MAQTTQTKDAGTAAAQTPAAQPAAQLPAAQEQKSGGGRQVAKLVGPRLPYHPYIFTAFGVDQGMWKALVESLYPMAKTTDAVCLALAYCKAKKYDIMMKPVHIVPMWNSALGREVETVWPGITQYRIDAHRTGAYAGTDETLFGDFTEEHFEAKIEKGKSAGKIIKADLSFPEWAQVTVYRIVQGQRIAFPGPRIMFMEFFGMDKGLPVPNARWKRAPLQMLEKCAEAAALRKAFPEVISEASAEEMEDRPTDREPPAGPTPARPAATGGGAEFKAENEVIEVEREDTPAHDPDTGEILEEGGEEEVVGDPRDQEEEADQAADYLDKRILDAMEADEATLTQLDQSVRRVLKTENREADLLPKWEAARALRADALKPPAEKAKPKQEEPAFDYDAWLKEQYELVANAKKVLVVEQIKDGAMAKMKAEHKPAFIKACNDRVVEIAPKAGK